MADLPECRMLSKLRDVIFSQVSLSAGFFCPFTTGSIMSRFQPRICLFSAYRAEVDGVASLSLEESWLELITDSEGEILPGLSQQGHVCLVGTERDEGGRGQRSTRVNKVDRVDTQFIGLSNIIKTKICW